MKHKFSSAWAFVEKWYAPNTDNYKENWDRIFGKKSDDDTNEDQKQGDGAEHTTASASDPAPSGDH